MSITTDVDTTEAVETYIYGVNETYRIVYEGDLAKVYVRKRNRKRWKLWRENITHARAKHLKTALDPRNSP